MKSTNTFKSNGPSVNKPFKNFNVKRLPTLNNKQSKNCMKCDGTLS